VRKHEDGQRKRITLTYDRIAVDGNTGGMKLSADSAKPDDSSPFGKVFAAIVGKEIRIVADENNKVESIEGLQEALSEAGEGAIMAQQFLNEPALKRMITKSALEALPDHPVKPGDSWPFSTEVPLPQMGQLNIKGTYTYKGTTQRAGVPCAEIRVDSSMSGSDSGDTSSGPLAQLGVKIELGTMKGVVYLDNALGAARETDLDQEINMTMVDPSVRTERVTIPMKQKVHTSIDKIENAP
jgi:hypothetical protein